MSSIGIEVYKCCVYMHTCVDVYMWVHMYIYIVLKVIQIIMNLI